MELINPENNHQVWILIMIFSRSSCEFTTCLINLSSLPMWTCWVYYPLVDTWQEQDTCVCETPLTRLLVKQTGLVLHTSNKNCDKYYVWGEHPTVFFPLHSFHTVFSIAREKYGKFKIVCVFFWLKLYSALANLFTNGSIRNVLNHQRCVTLTDR